jgi:hypothetical protein
MTINHINNKGKSSSSRSRGNKHVKAPKKIKEKQNKVVQDTIVDDDDTYLKVNNE